MKRATTTISWMKQTPVSTKTIIRVPIIRMCILVFFCTQCTSTLTCCCDFLHSLHKWLACWTCFEERIKDNGSCKVTQIVHGEFYSSYISNWNSLPEFEKKIKQWVWRTNLTFLHNTRWIWYMLLYQTRILVLLLSSID